MTSVTHFLLRAFLTLLALFTSGCNSTTESGLELSESNQTRSLDHVVEERSFGERQLEQLMSDRPDMQGVLAPDHAVYRWLVSSFEKERTGSRIYWVADQPSTGERAEHAPSYRGYPAYICITAGLDTSPRDKWTMLVFEMFNIENSESMRLLNDLGHAGKIDSDTFARKCVELEFKAAEKARKFLRENPLPNPDETKDLLYHWIVSEETPFHDHEKLWDSEENYLKDSNYRHFKKHYDELIAPYVSSGASSRP
jgi:hypothetical protein